MAIQYNENYNGTVPFSDVCEQFTLAATVAQTYTAPGTLTDIYQVTFSISEISNVFVCKNGTATIPASGMSSSVPYEERNPLKRYIRGGETLSLITPDTGGAYVGISLRAIS